MAQSHVTLQFIIFCGVVCLLLRERITALSKVLKFGIAVNAIRSNAPEDLGGDIGMDQNQWLAVRDDDDKFNK